MVLPEYTDETLRYVAANGSERERERAEALLKVPAAQRQRIEAEVTRRAAQIHWRQTSSGMPALMSERVASYRETRAEVVAAYLSSRRV